MSSTHEEATLPTTPYAEGPSEGTSICATSFPLLTAPALHQESNVIFLDDNEREEAHEADAEAETEAEDLEVEEAEEADSADPEPPGKGENQEEQALHGAFGQGDDEDEVPNIEFNKWSKPEVMWVFTCALLVCLGSSARQKENK